MSDQPFEKILKVQDAKNKNPLYSKQNKGDVKIQIKGYLRGSTGMNERYGAHLCNCVKDQEDYVSTNFVNNFLYAKCPDLMELSTFDSKYFDYC